MHNSPPSLPRWDLTTIYPSLVSPEFRQARDSLDADVTDLDALFDAHDISRMPSGLVDDETVAAFESIVARFNIAEQAFWELQDFVSAFVDTDMFGTCTPAPWRANSVQLPLVWRGCGDVFWPGSAHSMSRR